ncbi:MAG: EAL domain-containing protein [Pseudohongiellaceae bacterium]|nr:EAL domain-containing protein [Pseudohongiellaceae bacterium]
MPHSTDSDSTLARYSRDSADLLYSNSLSGSLINIVTVTALAFGFPGDHHAALKFWWWATMMVIVVARLIDAEHWRRSLRHTDYDGRAAIRRLATGVIITACGWCFYSLAVFDTVGTLELAGLICVIAGMASGATNVFSANRLIATAYVGILVLPLSIQGIVSGMQTWQTLGILGIAYFAVTATTAKRAALFTHKAIVLKSYNTELMEEMEKEKNVVGRINQELTNAYAQLNIVNNELEARVKRRTDKIYELSALDPLTALYNRKAFHSHLRRRLVSCEQQGKSLAVLFIDLDGFKKVNDSLGHQIGDEVLVNTSQRLLNRVSDKHNLCRWGGDEFLILMEECSDQEIIEFSEELIASVCQPISTSAETVTIGATIGISSYPQHGKTAEQLIQLADIAMYSQKKVMNPAPTVFSDVMLINLQRDQRIRDGLANALREDQFHIVYQPIISNSTGKTSNCEALLRWTFDGEVISPDEFIPVAEKYGFIRKIGAWVLEQACIDAQSWVDKSIAVSVNASIIQMLAEDMESTIKKALAISKIDPQRLHLELTETVFSSDTPTLQTKIARIQELGVKICIDDFGTGYSSLSQLQSLAVDVIKIDRAFINRLDGPGRAIIQAAMHIAKALNYEVIAEGIETEEQAKEIKEMGLKYMQGFLYARPMKKEQLVQWLENQSDTTVIDLPKIAHNP